MKGFFRTPGGVGLVLAALGLQALRAKPDEEPSPTFWDPGRDNMRP